MTTKYIKSPKSFCKVGEAGHKKGHHKPHRVGDRISFKTPSGRTSGTITSVSQEFYIVKYKNKLYKINRNSILYSMGTFVGGLKQLHENYKEAEKFGRSKEKERLSRFKKKYTKSKKHQTHWW